MKKIIVGVIFLAALLLAGLQARNMFLSDEKTFTSDADITHLEINDKNTAIEVVGTTNNAAPIKIRYTEDNKYRYTFDNQNGTLVMRKKSKPQRWFSLPWGFNFHDDTVQVEVPKAALENLAVTTTNSDITVDNLSVDAGTFRTTNDDVDLSDARFSDQLDVRTTNSKINLDTVTASRAKLNTTNDTVAFEDLDIKDSLTIRTTNSSVEGSILGRKKDFTIKSRTTNGENSLGSSSNNKSKSLDIRTTNDDIEVDFER